MLAGTTACVRRMTGAPVAAAATAAAAEPAVWVAALSWEGSCAGQEEHKQTNQAGRQAR